MRSFAIAMASVPALVLGQTTSLGFGLPTTLLKVPSAPATSNGLPAFAATKLTRREAQTSLATTTTAAGGLLAGILRRDEEDDLETDAFATPNVTKTNMPFAFAAVTGAASSSSPASPSHMVLPRADNATNSSSGGLDLNSKYVCSADEVSSNSTSDTTSAAAPTSSSGGLLGGILRRGLLGGDDTASTATSSSKKAAQTAYHCYLRHPNGTANATTSMATIASATQPANATLSNAEITGSTTVAAATTAAAAATSSAGGLLGGLGGLGGL